ncbi:MAG: sialidase family protein [Casimicrobiaceae bacterium]
MPNVLAVVIATLALAIQGPAAGAALGATMTAIEFYNPGLDHYFVSPLAPDIDALDSGRFSGWYRTGASFQVFIAPAATTSPVCRYYIPPEHGDSHFFSASPAECNSVAARIGTDPNYSGYVLESAAVFYVGLPDTSTGACAPTLVPLYRLWNGRADSNHRYTTDPAIKQAMIARGYLAEGYGPDAVAMCVAPAAAPVLAVASATTSFAPGCDATPASGVLYLGGEVEPYLAVHPANPRHLVGVWQQDRWSNGGARGVATGISLDGGRSWTRSTAAPAFSRCTGGAAVGADYARATDPWVTFSPDGTVHQIAVAFNGPTFGLTASNAVLASRSADGGFTWSAPVALVRDARTAFNDKESITADPFDAHYVYAAWDRLVQSGGGPAWFARTVDGGATWEPARAIYDPGTQSQTLNNQIVVLADGTLLDFFTRFDTTANNLLTATLAIIRSTDRGSNWSAPTIVAASLAVGVTDPDTGMPVRDAANIGAIAVGRDNRIAVVWQDSRFSAGAYDGIAFAQSLDGGITWSAPVRINAAPGTAAFIPTVKIADDGVIGVTYYDFRNNTAEPFSLPTDYWLTRSTDGVVWRETHVAGPFDLATAPVAQGYFLGDYQGLVTAGSTFLPLFAATTGDPANPTDIVVASIEGRGATAKHGSGRRVQVTPAPESAVTPTWRERLEAAARATLAHRRRGPPAAAD